MNLARGDAVATKLANGRVLVTGGLGTSGAPLNSAEIYDPATGTWTLTDSMSSPRLRHAATLLPDGRVIVAAGISIGTWIAAASILRPAPGPQRLAHCPTGRCRDRRRPRLPGTDRCSCSI